MITPLFAPIVIAALGPQPVNLPVVKVTRDDTVINQSCMIEIAPGEIIEDRNNNGVIQIVGAGGTGAVAANNIVVEFKPGSILRGAPNGTPGDQMTGTGIRLSGAAAVTLRGLNIQGYKVGVYALNSKALTLEKSEFRDNFRQRLRSTPSGEDGADWLFPHHNDKDDWITKWGAAVYMRACDGAVVRDLTVRDTQNGILLYRVNLSKIYDNDCSFLSGWGLGMFRSSNNVISRNAFDFCVRGHVEGVYNRGQDSAGILAFEQCSSNVFAENSVTHGGDGFFGFAGLEALNAEGAPANYNHTRKGCNDNLFIDNDFSYAPAHGLELTFSFGNKVIRNRFVENAICGIWGGYSQDFLIAENTFQGNGGMAYGLERGGVNIEHGAGNLILNNQFINNRCGIHLWWDGHDDFERKTWGKANYKGVTGNVIARNTFVINADHPFKNLRRDDALYAVQLRDDSPAEAKRVEAANRKRADEAASKNAEPPSPLPAPKIPQVHSNSYLSNSVDIKIDQGKPWSLPDHVRPGVELINEGTPPEYAIPQYQVFGDKRPVGARANLRGREKIVMTEWGPWDHKSPMLRVRSKTGSEHIYEIYGADPSYDHNLKLPGVKILLAEGVNGVPLTLRVVGEPGVHSYRLPMLLAGRQQILEGLIVGAEWTVTAFPWDKETDPREKLDAWRALAKSDKAVTTKTGTIKFPYGMGGPRDQAAFKQFGEKAPGSNHFGTIATTTFKLPKGKWTFRTHSDDGIRVTVNDKPVIEDWTWHAPKGDEGVFEQTEDAEVKIVVEHFEIDGFAVLELEIEPAQ